MTYNKASKLYENIFRKSSDETLISLQNDLLTYSVRYAQIRVVWKMADLNQRMEIENRRTSAHNAMIDAVNILSRYQQKHDIDISWREELGGDRKEIGDLACFIHCFLGIEAR